jgi:hypothetical protein
VSIATVLGAADGASPRAPSPKAPSAGRRGRRPARTPAKRTTGRRRTRAKRR